MATKVPTAAPVSTTATSSPSAATSALNNNSSKISGAATSIITAPLMSQSKSPNNASQVSASATPGKPAATTSAPVSTTNSSSVNLPPSKGKDTSGTGPTAPSGVGEIKNTGSGTTTTSSVVGGTTGTTSSSTPSSGTTPATKPAPVPSPTKPTDLKTSPSVMNGGSTIVMKQPPPPVTILPPTPAATPPSVHRQPPSLPQAQQSAQSAANSAAAPPTTAASTNQKPQSGNPHPPPSSSTNNTPVKQSSATPPIQEKKIENQEKPTQPTQPGINVQTKDQQKPGTQSGNQDQKVISNVTPSVTNPAATTTTAISSAGATKNITTTAATVSTTTPATVGGTSNNNISANKKVESVSQAPSSTVTNTNTVTTSAAATKSAIPTAVPSGKKMENCDPSTENIKSSAMDQIKNSINSSGMGGGGDAQILASGNIPKSMEVNNAKETEKISNLTGNNKFAGSADDKKNVSADKVGLNKADLILSKENANDMNRSIYIPSSNEPAIIGKEEKVMNGGQKKEEIGEDVKRIMDAIENAGLCGPKQPETSFDNGPESNNTLSGGDGTKGNKGSKIARSSLNNQAGRPSTAAGGMKSQSRPGTASSPTKNSPTKPRPATASAASKKDHGNENGSPNSGAVKNGKGKAAPASGLSNGSPGATLPPKSAASGPRTSTSRVSSAKGNTAPTSNSAKTPNQNKNTVNATKVSGVDSSSTSPVETETGTGSATGSRSASRLRPSSSLYRPTASSALKGVSSSSASNSPSNHSLLSSPSTPRTPRSSTGARASRSSTTMGDSAGGSGEGKPATLREQFTAFSRFGNKDEDGKHITLSNCDKWMKQAKVIDGKKITTTDTSICFKKLFKTAKKITFEDFKKYVEELAKSKKIEPSEILEKLANCGPPGHNSAAAKAAHSNVVDRLTDTSKYTGSHKERFDATGKGRGIEGRKDTPDGSGYVAAFKEKLDLKESAEAKKEESNSTSPTPAK